MNEWPELIQWPTVGSKQREFVQDTGLFGDNRMSDLI